MFFSTWEKKVSLYSKFFFFFCQHQRAKGIKFCILCFSIPSSLKLTAHIYQDLLNSQLACSRYLSLSLHKWLWHSTVFIHEPFPPLLLCSLLHILQLELPSGTVCSFIMHHHCFYQVISISALWHCTESNEHTATQAHTISHYSEGIIKLTHLQYTNHNKKKRAEFIQTHTHGHTHTGRP